MPPKDQRDQWDGKSWFPLGKNLSEAYKTWAARLGDAAQAKGKSLGKIMDRYLLEVVPTVGVRTQTEYRRALKNLRAVFGEMSPEDVEPQHVYQYVDKRSSKPAAKKEVEVFSAMFTKAVEWGIIRAHPFKGEVRLAGSKPRDRYVEDWELEESLSLEPRRRKGSVGMVHAYLRLKLLTGLRQKDLLLLKLADCKDDGIHVTPSKTKNTTGKKLIYEWSDALRAAVEEAKMIRPALSPYLFCNKFGHCYVDPAKETAKGFNKIWQNFIARVLEDTEVTERFTEHDLRAKVGSDAESLRRAQELLAHADARMTDRVYRRKPARIAPAK
jgi:integrase